MRRVFVALIGISILAGSLSPLKASPGQNPEKQILKTRQKEERKALKQKQHYEKLSLRGQRIPKAVRAQRQHEIDREKRALRDRQKDEMQDLKDRQKLLKESVQARG